MTVRELALAVADALEDESTWTHDVTARDVAGRSVEALDPSAVCWCADGHAIRIGGVELEYKLAEAFRHRYDWISSSNDGPFGRQKTQARLRELAASLEGK